jgi:GNAT superfamily N-acetyltransferase
MNMANVVVGVIAWHGPVRAGAALKVLIWAGVLMIYGFNYVFFVHQQRYVRVHDEFRRRGIGTRKCLRVIAWTYLIGSFVMPVVLGFLFLLD